MGENDDFEILGIAGSLRRASIHRGLLRAAKEPAPEGILCDGLDLGAPADWAALFPETKTTQERRAG